MIYFYTSGLFTRTPHANKPFLITAVKAADKSCLTNPAVCEGSFGLIRPLEPPKRVDPGGVKACVEKWPTTAEKLNIDTGNYPKRSRLNEDRIIASNFFPNKTGGFYSELGAFDGIIESNTRLFEECMGWGGLLIEGNPSSFTKLQQDERRPSATKLHVVPGCPHDPHAVSTVEFARWDNSAGSLATYATNKNIKTSKVHCAPLWVYLEQLAITHVDFFSLDVEGAEVDVLKGVDFQKTTFDVIMVESRNRMCEDVCPKREQVRALLDKEGFRLLEGLVPNSDTFLSPRVKGVAPSAGRTKGWGGKPKASS